MPLVYQATNSVNGKAYIGVTRKTLEYRRSGHEKKAREGAVSRIHAALRKYGTAAFSWVVLEEYVSYEEALAAEIRLIAHLKPAYNVLPGGERGWTISPESRERMAAAKRGKKASAETRAKMSAARKGKSLALGMGPAATAKRNRERKWTAESREKIRQALLGRKQTAAHRANAAAGQRGRKPTVQRPVMCLDDGRIFFSARDAERAYGMPQRSVCQICRRPPKLGSKYNKFVYISERRVVSEVEASFHVSP